MKEENGKRNGYIVREDRDRDGQEEEEETEGCMETGRKTK